MAIDLISLAEVKTYLNISHSNDDSLLNSLIASVSAFIRNKTNRIFEEQSYTEDLNGGDSYLIVSHRPIVSVASIKDLRDSPPSTVDAADYKVLSDQGLIAHTDTDGNLMTWEEGWQRFEVTYTAGYAVSPDEIPDDLKLAAKMLVGARYERRSGDLQSETLGEYSYRVKDDYAQEAMDIINQYREPVF